MRAAHKKVIGATEDYDLKELIGGSVKDIEAFIASREDELFEEDYRAMLEHEEAKKKPRTTLVHSLKALIGEEE